MALQLVKPQRQDEFERRRLEAPGGFEPPHNGFADRPLSHLGMAPQRLGQKRLAQMSDNSRGPPRLEPGFLALVGSRPRATSSARREIFQRLTAARWPTRSPTDTTPPPGINAASTCACLPCSPQFPCDIGRVRKLPSPPLPIAHPKSPDDDPSARARSPARAPGVRSGQTR